MQVILYIGASLDGYIAGPNGEIDWLSMVDREGADYGYNEFYQSVDAVVSGGKTYELALSFPEWPHPGKPTFVFTRRPLKSERDDVFFLSEEVDQAMEKIKAQGFQRVWLLGGGELVRSFLQHGLIDEYIISTIPIILGTGIPLFPPPGPEQKLELISSRQYESGLLQVHYKNRESH
jgi:dihydrofolate reductase